MEKIKILEDKLNSILLGKPHVIRIAIISLVSKGHLLLNDVPGVGKTLLGKSLASLINKKFVRIQMTPDMLPSDILGSSIFNPQTSKFEFIPGPIFTNIILADEINRASPRTQSALLEAMEERQVSIDGISHRLDKDFMIIATQNPLEHKGTFPLPEAQLDRFMVSTSIGYPDKATEINMLKAAENNNIKPVIDEDELEMIYAKLANIRKSDIVLEYIVNLLNNIRNDKLTIQPPSPRAGKHLLQASIAHAMLDGKEYVEISDVIGTAIPVLQHRIILSDKTPIDLFIKNKLDQTTIAANK
jgi:MoxR-like ATPase